MQYLALIAASLAAASPLASVPSSILDTDVPNYALWNADSDITPEPIRGQLGATILGPQNVPLELQNADLLAPPTTDHGAVCVASSRYLRCQGGQ
jgi:hypothetical protein